MQYHISLTEHAISQFRKRFTDTLCKMPSEIATLFNILNSGELVRRDGRWVVLNGPFEGRLVRKEFGKYILTTVVRVHKGKAPEPPKPPTPPKPRRVLPCG